jgi:hypothetical protein
MRSRSLSIARTLWARAWLGPFAAAFLGLATAIDRAPAGPPEDQATPAQGGRSNEPDQGESIVSEFYRTGIDRTTSYAVSEVLLGRDNLALQLRSGTLFFIRPIDGETTGAVFIGEGTVRMTPPNRTERYMLRARVGADRLEEPFTEAVLRFDDGADRVLRTAVEPGAADPALAARAEELLRQRNAMIDGARWLALEMRHLETRASGLDELGFFLADLHTARHGWIVYYRDPQEIHENVLFTTETLGTKRARYPDIWTSWHAPEDYDPVGRYRRNPERDGARLFRIVHNELQIDLPSMRLVEWEARLTIEIRDQGLQALLFDLANNADSGSAWSDENFRPVRLLSVTDTAGNVLRYRHRKDRVLVYLPRPCAAGERVTLAFRGTAEVVYQLTAESYGLLQASWYPQYGYLGRQTIKWTVKVKKPYLITGSGHVMREFEAESTGQNGLELQMDVPVSFPWVIFGRFQKAASVFTSALEPVETVGLTIHSFPTMTITNIPTDVARYFGLQPGAFSLHAPVTKVNGLLAETKEILKLFEELYGPFPYTELHLAQMAPQLGFGQAPPGFVQLTGMAFLSQARTNSDFLHGFLAHEAAHQWWGNQIGWASGDDEWLSESFAEYASGLFVKEYQGAGRFQRTLEEWKRNAKISDAAAPIQAANTLSGQNASLHRTNLLYNKGPYVLHMLRVMLDDERYVQVMRRVQEEYRHRNISNEMLMRTLNQVTGSDYNWFFEQWFYDVGIPTIRYRWTSEPQPDGKHLIAVHVSQDKGTFKRVLVPVMLRFKSGVVPAYKEMIEPEQVMRFMAPERPKDVTLDDEHTLLAEIVRRD